MSTVKFRVARREVQVTNKVHSLYHTSGNVTLVRSSTSSRSDAGTYSCAMQVAPTAIFSLPIVNLEFVSEFALVTEDAIVNLNNRALSAF